MRNKTTLTPQEVSGLKNSLQNAAYARPESQNIKLDVFSVMRKSEKRKEKLGRFLVDRTEARKIVFGGPYATVGSVWRPAVDFLKKDRAGRLPHDLGAALEKSLSVIIVLTSPVQTISRCEETSQKPKSNREESAHSAKPRRRNIQSASRAYEKRRKPGSVSPRRERRPRPHSANVGMRRYGGGYKAPFYTTVRPTRTFSPV